MTIFYSQTPGPMLALPLHLEDHGQGEGREAEAVSAPGPAGWFLSFFNISPFIFLCPGEGAQVICPH